MRKIAITLFCLSLALHWNSLSAQSVAINEDGTAADPSAMLDVQSATKGLLAPRMTTAEKTAIDPAAVGLIVFDTDLNNYYFYNGANWSAFGSGEVLWESAGADITNLNAGNIAVGSGTAEQKLHVFGNIKITDSGNSDGKLFVGTTTAEETNAGNYSLLVNGSGIMTELKINLAANWPDYVFSDAYRLMPIDRLADYIQRNKHLPGMPSARQVAEEGGFHVGEVQRKMLEKLEELTLYIIDLKEENESLKSELDELKAKVRRMDDR